MPDTEVRDELRVRFVTVHGHRRAYVKTGSGPVILLIHGVGMDHKSWLPVISLLRERFTVIAPDLLGHGASAKPRADYSIAGYANGMRDLMSVLGVQRATVVGHSLGGGIAMQLAYQFPQMTERLVLVAAGGLGSEVNPIIRFCTLPGSGPALRVLGLDVLRKPFIQILQALHGTGLPLTQDLRALAEVYDDLADPAQQWAFLHVLRGAVDWRGQVISGLDRAYLAEHMPSMVVWGANDLVIPASHAVNAHRALPGSRLEIFPDSGHNPHEDEPERFAEVLDEFVTTAPRSKYSASQWRKALVHGASGGGRTRSRPDLRVVVP